MDLEPVLLRTVTSELEAEMVVGLIESNDLRAYSINASSHGVSHYGGQSARSGPLALYRIYVHPDDETAARELLEGADEESHADLTPEAIEDASGSEPSPTGRERTKRLVAGVVLLLLAYPIGLAVVDLYRTLFGG